MPACAATGKDGSPCRLYPRHGRDLCINHDPDYADQRRANVRAGGRARNPEFTEIPEAIARHNVRKSVWWLTEQLVLGTISSSRALALSRLLHTAAQMGPDEMDEEQILREVELRGVLMNGIPPRNEAEWELAASIFDDDAIAEFKRWEMMQR